MRDYLYNLSSMFKKMNNREVLKATILKKLKRRGKWGAAHTSFDILLKITMKKLILKVELDYT